MYSKEISLKLGRITVTFPYFDFLLLKLGIKKGIIIHEKISKKTVRQMGNMLLLGKLYYSVSADDVLVSRHKLPKLSKDQPTRAIQIGKFLGYPSCCVKQFVKDMKKDHNNQLCYPSIYAAKRFLKQCNKKEKNKFGVHTHKNGVASFIGFIPCSPTCKKANLILDCYYEVCRALLLIVWDAKIHKKIKKELGILW